MIDAAINNNDDNRLKVGLYYVEFDVNVGPVVTCSTGEIDLDEDSIKSLKFNAFPESANVKEMDIPHIYSFSVLDMYCYCYYVCESDSSYDRGFHQYSFVIMTYNNFFPVWFKLLESVRALSGFKPHEIYELLFKFSCNIYNNLSDDFGLDLPLFTGSTTIGELIGLSHVINNNISASKPSFKSFDSIHFHGCDIFSNLFVSDLCRRGRFREIIRLWECVILEKPLLVYGPNPSVVSRAVFAIASLSFDSSSNVKVYPYMCITDPRFPELSKNPHGIAGISNPMALKLCSAHDNVFFVGIDNKNGFMDGKGSFFPSHEVDSSGIYSQISSLSDLLRDAIFSSLKEMQNDNPFLPLLGRIDLNILEKHLTGTSMEKEVALLTHTLFFRNILYSYILTDEALDSVKSFSFQGLSPAEKKYYCHQIAKLLRKKKTEKNIEIVLRDSLRNIYDSLPQVTA